MAEWEKEIITIIPRHSDLEDTALNDLEKSRNEKTQLRLETGLFVASRASLQKIKKLLTSKLSLRKSLTSFSDSFMEMYEMGRGRSTA